MISILYDIFTLLCSLVSSFPYSSLSYLSLRATHAMPPVLHHHPLSCLIVHCMSWSISHLTPTSPCFCIKVACQTALAFGTRPWPSEIKLSLNFFLRHAPSQSASRSSYEQLISRMFCAYLEWRTLTVLAEQYFACSLHTLRYQLQRRQVEIKISCCDN